MALNVLWIYGEDLSPDIACYGTPAVQTPNIDRLAAEGALYTNAFVTCPVCSPSRSALITGTYQTSFGAHQHRSKRNEPLPEHMELITDRFRAAGYFTSNSPGPPFKRRGKTDFNFNAPNPFDGIDWSERGDDQPFYAQCNIPDTHRVFTRDPERPVDPEAAELPPYYPDHPLTRADWARYLESVQVVDRKLGEILRRLEEEGLADNTAVFFLSDHGRAHPRCKQFLYDGGIRIPLIARIPGGEKGVVKDDLVSGVDMAPTALSLAGLPIPGYMEGAPFLGADAQTRDRIVSARDRCDGTDDRIRCIRTKTHKYIRNFHPERPYLQFNAYKKVQYPVLALMEALRDRGELNEAQLPFMADERPAEELYDLQNDPHETKNLAAEAGSQETLRALRQTLDEWIRVTADQGEEPEDPAVAAEEDEKMQASYESGMERRDLPTDISPEAYLNWWMEQFELS